MHFLYVSFCHIKALFCSLTFGVTSEQYLNKVLWCRCVVTVLAWPPEAEWQRDTRGRIYRSAGLTAETLWQDLHPVWFYKQAKGALTLCGTRWSRSFFLFLHLYSPGPNSEKHSFDTCIAPGGNTFAQSTRQLILSMSGALGERMKQRFDLIGYEKVSHLCPVGREEGYRGKGWHMQGQMHKAMIYLCDSHLSQGATFLLHP